MAGSDLLKEKHERDIEALLKSRRHGFARTVLYALFVIGVLYAALFALQTLKQEGDSLELARNETARSSNPAIGELVSSYDGYRAWLHAHGSSWEGDVFDSLAQIMFRAALSTDQGSADQEPGFLLRTLIALYAAVLRVAFVLVACWRFWLMAAVLSFYLSFRRLKPHGAHDILGETGNGRVFFSGSTVRLDARSQSGANDMLVTGLSCVKRAPAHVAKASDLGQLLVRFNVANDTNLSLAAVITAHAHYPAYVAESDEQALLENFFEGATLSQNAFLLLEKALSLHSNYQLAVEASAGDYAEVEALARDEKVDRYYYTALMQHSMTRVLTPELRRDLAALSAAQVACAILAYEAGKVLTYAHEGGEWLRKSKYGYLNARAVLHATPEFEKDFDFQARIDVRRALIYASRSSEFGPVRFPLDLSERSAALRQWIELLTACPHQLQAVTDEVELFGLVRESEMKWAQHFLDGATVMKPEAVDGAFATPSNLFFMPLKRVVALCREVIDASRIRRLEELSLVVSQRQKLHSMSIDFSAENERSGALNYERILPPLSFGEIKVLAETHALKIDELKDWSALRVIFNSFGWLGRRVGNHSVPDSSVVFAVFMPNMPAGSPVRPRAIGRPGMVPFRATRLEARWGRSWVTRFVRVESASMAESREDYERELAGLPEKPIAESDMEVSGV